MNVLLVDDSQTMRNIQKRSLAAIPEAALLEAGDGVQALKIFDTTDVTLALVDWNMPNMDGLTLVKKIRETNKTTLLVMCTTEAEKPRIIEAIKAGVNNYVVKPFTPEVLIEKVRQTLEKLKTAA